MRARLPASLVFRNRRKRERDLGAFGVLFKLEGSGTNFDPIASCCSDARKEDNTYDNGGMTVCNGDHVILHFFQLEPLTRVSRLHWVEYMFALA